jgi:ethanolamine utilization protein EutN
MYLGRVAGCVWATVKHPDMQGLRMLIVQPVAPDLRPTGRRLVCTDVTGAGTGELVYWVRGREAALPFAPAAPPVDATVVGIVDSLHLASPVQASAQAAPRRRKRARKE